MTLPLKFNADYETVLFTGKEAPSVINQSLEFLLFYLQDAPLYSTKKYADDYLKHVEQVSGRRPQIVSKGPFINWWGELKDIPFEKKVNSKAMSARFIEEAQIITKMEGLKIDPVRRYLAKPVSEMSGRGFCVFDETQKQELENLLKKSHSLIVEPFLDRKFDFSHYVLPDQDICYENIVDSRFQYKGTTFRNLKNPSIESLSFYPKVSGNEWHKFKNNFQKIKAAYAFENVTCMYSIDSFVYSDNGVLKIRDITEVNVRKTMGYIAWKLSEKFARNFNWSQLLLAKKTGNLSFGEVKKKAQSHGCLYLSPGDTRFEIFFLMAESEEIGKKKLEDLKKLLPNAEFPI